MTNRFGNSGNSDRLYLGASKTTAGYDCSHEIKRHFLLGRRAITRLDSILKSRDVTLLTKVHLVKVMAFPVVMYGCESWTKESWAPENSFFWTVVVVKTLENLLEIKAVNPRGNWSWIFIGRTDAEAETPTLWPPDVKNWLIWKDPDAGKDWRQEEKGMTEDEKFGRCHQHAEPELEQASGIGDGQGSLVCCSPWGHKESDTTEQVNWTAARNAFTFRF